MVTITMVMELAMEVVVFSINLAPSVSRNASSVNLHNYVQPSMIRQPSHLPYQPQQQPQPQQQLLIKFTLKENPQLDSLRNHHH